MLVRTASCYAAIQRYRHHVAASSNVREMAKAIRQRDRKATVIRKQQTEPCGHDMPRTRRET